MRSSPRRIPVAVASIVSLTVVLAIVLVPVAVDTSAHVASQPGLATGGLPSLETNTVMGFTSHTVTPAIGVVQDLYEPTITTSGTGALYVAGHVIGAHTTGTPAFVSTDDGVSWNKLPVAAGWRPPSPISGAGPPGGDEGVIVADDAGHAWMVDMQDGVSISVQGWCNDGATACFYQPDAFNNAHAATCNLFEVGSLATDRPWAAHAKVGSANKLLIVNNGFTRTSGNVLQMGLLDVTPGLPAGAVPPTWNGCAGGEGYIPGVPSMSSAGRFIVPHIEYGASPMNLKAITGTTAGGVLATSSATAFTVEKTELACSSNFGFSGVSDDGTFYIAAADTTDLKRIKVATTTAGSSFDTVTLDTDYPVAFLWITGSQTGEGALISWAETHNSNCTNVDFHTAHVTLDANGDPQFSNESTVVTGRSPCGDLMGSSVGPDGNAAVVVFSHPNQCLDTPLPGGQPLTVYVQTSGSTLP